MAETRKIAAILVADVVGYSRLAGADEDRTLSRLRGLRSDLIDPAIAAHRGRVVKRTGDGIVIEFRSVVDAVRCAIEVQTGTVERNAGLPPERRIELRVGIHLGDVVEESDGDLMGDGVNIAARLESICEPGAICLSEDAYRQVKGRLDLAVSDLGPTQLKNIADPVRVYSLEVSKPAQVRATKPAAPKQRSMFMLLAAGLVALAVIAAGVWLAMKPARGPEVSATTPRLSIVVLPFANLSGDPGQDYLADVLTEGLTTGLSRISGTFVIARSTAFTYKGKPADVKQVGRDLGVRYVLEGSEQHSGNQVRVNAQLIDAETGAHLWADQFDADRTDLLQMQDEIVTRLARAMQIQLVAVDAARVTRTRPGNLDAEDLALRCEAGIYNSPAGPAEFTAAFDLCDRALHIDNSNVFALTGMTMRHILPVVEAQSSDPQADIGRADELVSRALAIDPNYYFAHFAKAYVLMAQGHTQEAVVEGERSLALNPSFIDAYGGLCIANNFLGRPDRALELAEKAIRLSPRDPFLRGMYHMKGWAFFMKQQDDQAIDWLRRAEGVSVFTDLILAAALALTGQQADAHETLKRYLAVNGVTTTTIAQLRKQQLSLADNSTCVAYNERLFDGLRKAGMPEE
jgi:TolB-like protein/class 3 adenylate cyclase/Tfp pilus assembly protein PilF